MPHSTIQLGSGNSEPDRESFAIRNRGLLSQWKWNPGYGRRAKPGEEDYDPVDAMKVPGTRRRVGAARRGARMDPAEVQDIDWREIVGACAYVRAAPILGRH